MDSTQDEEDEENDNDETESIIEQMEENLDAEIDEFDNVNNVLEIIEEDFEHDITPRRLFGMCTVDQINEKNWSRNFCANNASMSQPNEFKNGN